MPPADNNTPAPVPTPEPPKQGFFAKLFGKKPKESVVPPQHESQTPPPDLGDVTSAPDGSTPVSPAAPFTPAGPTVGMDVTSPNGTQGGPELSQSAPTVSPDEEPNTLAVPPSLSSDPVEADETNVSPTLPTQPPADSSPEGENPSDGSSEGTPPAPQQ